MNHMSKTPAARKATNVSLDADLLSEAKELGINVSRACEAGLAEQVKRARWAKWEEENAAGIAASNAYVEEHGLPLERHRLF